MNYKYLAVLALCGMTVACHAKKPAETKQEAPAEQTAATNTGAKQAVDAVESALEQVAQIAEGRGCDILFAGPSVGAGLRQGPNDVGIRRMRK